MSIAQRINDLAGAIGKALKDAKANSAADTTTLMQLKNTVDSAGQRVRALKALAERLLISLQVVGIDPGEGTELATQHGLMVVDGANKSCWDGAYRADIRVEDQKVIAGMIDTFLMCTNSRIVGCNVLADIVMDRDANVLYPTVYVDLEPRYDRIAVKNIITNKTVYFYNEIPVLLDEHNAIFDADDTSVCLELSAEPCRAAECDTQSETADEKVFYCSYWECNVTLRSSGEIKAGPVTWYGNYEWALSIKVGTYNNRPVIKSFVMFPDSPLEDNTVEHKDKYLIGTFDADMFGTINSVFVEGTYVGYKQPYS